VVQDLKLLGGGSWKSVALKRGEWKKSRVHTGLSADDGDEFTMPSIAGMCREMNGKESISF
jgi:hypothetical protein